MRDLMDHGPEEPTDAWLLEQLAAAAGPRDVSEMSDAELEDMLDVCRDETYAPDQVERLLARFWIAVSAMPSTGSSDERIGGDIAAPPAGAQPSNKPPLPLTTRGKQIVMPAAAGNAQARSRRAGTPQIRALVEELVSVVEPGEGIPLGSNPIVVAGHQHDSPLPPSPPSPVLGFLGSTRRRTADFLSDYSPLLCLAGVVLFGLVLAWQFPMSGRAEIASNKSASEIQANRTPADVGHISAAFDCAFDGDEQPAENALVTVGQKLRLERGLLEITYDAGATIVLQGPATYTVESARGGFLSVGKLTALVQSDRRTRKSRFETTGPKFMLGTPFVTVNDLGTEFGVEVRPSNVTDVSVFRGKVQTVMDSAAGLAPVRERLVAGDAIRFVARDATPQRATVASLGTAPLPSPGKLLLVARNARESQLLVPSGLVATAYHRVWDAHGHLIALGDRRRAFQFANDGIFGRGENAEGPRSSFDTLDAGNTKTDFVGLTYQQRVRIDRVKIFLGHQFGDGGSWGKPPRVFVLVNPVDPGSIPPESDPANWRELPPPQVSYGNPFYATADVNPGEVMEFVLTDQPAEYRTGFGWAIGGVAGNGIAGYVSITELRGYGAELVTH